MSSATDITLSDLPLESNKEEKDQLAHSNKKVKTVGGSGELSPDNSTSIEVRDEMT